MTYVRMYCGIWYPVSVVSTIDMDIYEVISADPSGASRLLYVLCLLGLLLSMCV